jgi:hypothetical protein
MIIKKSIKTRVFSQINLVDAFGNCVIIVV